MLRRLVNAADRELYTASFVAPFGMMRLAVAYKRKGFV
jgi:hypothetical protein